METHKEFIKKIEKLNTEPTLSEKTHDALNVKEGTA